MEAAGFTAEYLAVVDSNNDTVISQNEWIAVKKLENDFSFIADTNDVGPGNENSADWLTIFDFNLDGEIDSQELASGENLTEVWNNTYDTTHNGHVKVSHKSDW